MCKADKAAYRIFVFSKKIFVFLVPIVKLLYYIKNYNKFE